MRRAVPAVAALAAVFLLDAVTAAREWPLLVVGLLDEPAHLLTAWLFLSALLPARLRGLGLWALVGAVVVDVDHVPLYLWDVGAANPEGRPLTHSLGVVVLLLLLGASASRLRVPLCGLGLGVLLHLVRDVATGGPGVPLWWPAPVEDVRLPYLAYAVALTLVATAAAVRAVARSSAGAQAQPRE